MKELILSFLPAILSIKHSAIEARLAEKTRECEAFKEKCQTLSDELKGLKDENEKLKSREFMRSTNV